MPGNLLGQKVKVAYTTDSGVKIRLSRDIDLVPSSAGLATDLTGTTPRPTGFTPRGVYVEATIAGDENISDRKARKFIVCAANSTLYTSDQPQNVSIDGVVFKTTGRKGETQRFI